MRRAAAKPETQQEEDRRGRRGPRGAPRVRRGRGRPGDARAAQRRRA